MRILIILSLIIMTGCVGNNQSGGSKTDSSEKIRAAGEKVMYSKQSPNLSITINAEGLVESGAVREMLKEYGQMPQNTVDLKGKSNITSDTFEKITSWYKSSNPFTLILYALGFGMLMFFINRYIGNTKRAAAMAGSFLKSTASQIDRKVNLKEQLSVQLDIVPEAQKQSIKGRIKGLEHDITEARDQIAQYHNKNKGV